jgi:hypothetical protein
MNNLTLQSKKISEIAKFVKGKPVQNIFPSNSNALPYLM